MRLLEILILLINLPLIFRMFFPKQQDALWLRLLPVIGVVIIFIHLFVEGYRWQMIPVYFSSALLLLFVIMKQRTGKKYPLFQQKLFNRIIASLSIIFIASSAVLGTFTFHLCCKVYSLSTRPFTY